MPSRIPTPVKPGSGANVAVSAAFGAIALCGVLVVVVSMMIGAIGASESALNACGGTGGVDPAVVSADAPGSLGGMYGTGITRAEFNTVKSHAHGSKLTPGTYLATSYGPPWGVQNGVDQGAGIGTAAGVRFNGGAPPKYLIAVDPTVIDYGQWVYVWPNQFGWPGPFLAADTGGAIKGQHIDVYDWRGNFKTLPGVQVSSKPIAPGAPSATTVDPQLQAVNLPAAQGADPQTPAAAGAPSGGAPSGGGFDEAIAAAQKLSGTPVGLAVVDAAGTVVASYRPDDTNRSASITKALILVGLTQKARDRDLTSSERQDAQAMIRQSDNQAANRLYAQVGAQGVRAAAAAAGMTHFKLIERKQSAEGFVLGYSKVTAGDLARLFAKIDTLLADKHRDFGVQQLANIEGAGRFGVYQAGVTGQVLSKSGWRQEDDGGATVNQAVQVDIGGLRYGVAITLGGQASVDRGEQAVADLMRAVLQATPAGTAAAASSGPCGVGGVVSSGPVGDRIAQIAGQYLGKDARAEPFKDFEPPTTQDAWCAWFATNVWRLAGVAIQVDWFSAFPYTWAKPRGQLFKDFNLPPSGPTPPLGSALMYGNGPQNTADSQHVNLVTKVNPDGSFMLIGGNQGNSTVSLEGPCKMTVASPARLSGPGCDPRPVYAIATPTAGTPST